jgi:hypothetical protein
MNSIVRVGDGDGLNREQWNLSGDRRVSVYMKTEKQSSNVSGFNQ